MRCEKRIHRRFLVFSLMVAFLCVLIGNQVNAGQTEEVTYDNYATIKVGQTITISNMTDLGLTEGWLYKCCKLSNDNVDLDILDRIVHWSQPDAYFPDRPECILEVTGVQDGTVILTCWSGNYDPKFNIGGDTSGNIEKNEHYIIDVIEEKIVTLNVNGGSCSTTSKTVWRKDEVGTLPTPTRTGYNFLGWYTSATGGTKVSTSTVVNGDVTYYAHWEKTILDVSFDANGGEVSSTHRSVKKGSTVGKDNGWKDENFKLENYDECNDSHCEGPF